MPRRSGCSAAMRPNPSTSRCSARAASSSAARSAELTRQEVEQIVVDGFFPQVEAGELPRRARDRRIRAALCERRGRHAARRRVPESSCGRPAARHAAAQRRRVPRWRFAGISRRRSARGAVRRSTCCTTRIRTSRSRARSGHGNRARRACAAHRRQFRAQLFPRARRWRRRRARGVCLLPRGTEEGHEIRLDDRTFALQLSRCVSTSCRRWPTPRTGPAISSISTRAISCGCRRSRRSSTQKWAAMRAKHR